jgi:UDP-galactopyranose mutase
VTSIDSGSRLRTVSDSPAETDAPAYDYLIVGCGLFGATFARLATDAGKRCLIVERRPHIGGNCYT